MAHRGKFTKEQVKRQGKIALRSEIAGYTVS